MSQPPLFGSEEELALVAHTEGGVQPAPAELAEAVTEEAAAKVKSLPSPPPQRRFFLANGGCLYPDMGHAEVASAEASDPYEMAAQRLALRQMVAEAAQEVGRHFRMPVHLVANNVDYALGGARSYGHHLNVLVDKITLPQAAAQLAPLLAAMPAVAGTGKISFATGSCGFELSQRAVYFDSLLSKRTTTHRGMITAKDEALCARGTRVHVISLDTAMSPWQLVLVPGMVALTLDAVMAGADVARQVAVADVPRALQRISTDPSLKATVRLQNGGAATALDILDHYGGAVETHAARNGGPPWARHILSLWQSIVSRLRADPFEEAGRLDWVRKLLVFTKTLRGLDLDWNVFAKWKSALATLRRLKATWPEEINPQQLTSSAVARARRHRIPLSILDQHLRQAGLSWSEVPRFWKAANCLCQQCVAYHRVTPTEDATWPLTAHSPLSQETVKRAGTEPPSGTRAAVRAKAIADAPPGATAGWDFVQVGGRRFVMPDAFGKEARWQDLKSGTNKMA